MDLKQLFHNPEDLDDYELSALRSKIQFQASLPYYCAFFSGLSMRIVDAHLFRAGFRPLRIGAMAAFGWYIGAQGACTMGGSLFREFDREITLAFDERYMTRSLNVAGWNNNAISFKDNQDQKMLHKVY